MKYIIQLLDENDHVLDEMTIYNSSVEYDLDHLENFMLIHMDACGFVEGVVKKYRLIYEENV